MKDAKVEQAEAKKVKHDWNLGPGQYTIPAAKPT